MSNTAASKSVTANQNISAQINININSDSAAEGGLETSGNAARVIANNQNIGAKINVETNENQIAGIINKDATINNISSSLADKLSQAFFNRLLR